MMRRAWEVAWRWTCAYTCLSSGRCGAVGATWLDQQLIRGGKNLSDRQALQLRADFRSEQGLSERRGTAVLLVGNLLATLRKRELKRTAKDIAAEAGLAHQPVVDGDRASGIYRRRMLLASGRFAMLDDGLGFGSVPWKPVPVIESRLGLSATATLRNNSVS